MTITAGDRKRIKALSAIASRSFGARLEALTDEQRAAYEQHRSRMSEWTEKLIRYCPEDIDPDEYLYKRTLEKRSGEPKLRRDIDAALFGKATRILSSDTEETAVRKWMECTR